MTKITFKVVDMDNQMQATAIKVSYYNFLLIRIKSIQEAFENLREERFIANKIRDDFDKIYGNLPFEFET